MSIGQPNDPSAVAPGPDGPDGSEVLPGAVTPSFRTPPVVHPHGLRGVLSRLQLFCAMVSGVAVVVAGCVLTYGMVIRYVLRIPTDWQDELSILLLVGATFFSAGWVQAHRGHVAIDALAELLPPGPDRVRRWIADLLTVAFCLFFSWKSWTLCLEALHEGQVSQSSWAPPMWIPYSLMSIGMSLVTLQLLAQLTDFRTPVLKADPSSRH